MKIIYLELENGTEQYYAQGDIMVFDLVKFLDIIPLKADLIYTDPPWSDGNCKYWRTIAHKQDNNIESYKLSYHTFLSRLHEQLPHTPLFIEGSRLTYNTILNVFGEDYKYNRVFKVFYDKDIEQRLIFFNDNPIILDLNDMVDLEYVQAVFTYYNYTTETVLDPCTGLGITPKTAYKFNKNFIGFDLNKTRLDKTIQLFKNKTERKDEIWIEGQNTHL